MKLLRGSGKENSAEKKSNTDMTFSGLDIFSKIRKLIRGTTETNSLKRRSEDQPDYNHLNKYRRVNNDFPKIITKPFEDEIRFIRPVMSNKKPNFNLNRRSASKYFSTKSNLPNTYADLEYSDDELDVEMAHHLYSNKPLASSSFNSPDLMRNISSGRSKYQFMQSNDDQRTVNIPIKMLDANKKPMPPLIEARTGNLFGSNYLPHLRPIRKNSPMVSPNNSTDTGRSYLSGTGIDYGCERYLDNDENDIILTNNGLELPPLQIDLPHRYRSINPNSKYLGNTVSSQAYNVKQRNTYADLLKQLVPKLYTSRKSFALLPSNDDNSNHSEPLPSPQTPLDEIDLTEERNELSSQSNNVIDLADEESEYNISNDDDFEVMAECNNIINKHKLKPESPELEIIAEVELPLVEPVNSLKERNKLLPVYEPKWLENFRLKCREKQRIRTIKINEAAEDVRIQSAETEKHERIIETKLKNFVISAEVTIIDECEAEEELEFPEFSDEDEALIKRTIYRGAQEEVLIERFNMSISRRDLQTLTGDNWLNDEVINFYMNLLMERGDVRSSEGYPKIYAMNTFFLPRLLSSGHMGVRRWTRKVDIFKYDIIPVPVHVGGVHWCMAVIHFRNKTIKYYDSMGTPNHRVLQMLEQYLREESLDKRKIPFDTADFEKACVPDCPRQMNGSDCGVFSCMFAEYLCRDRPITFSQQHMHYFRHRMILEILKGELTM